MLGLSLEQGNVLLTLQHKKLLDKYSPNCLSKTSLSEKALPAQ